jgi:hypothetical protein
MHLRSLLNSPPEATPKRGLSKRKEEDNNVVGEVKGLGLGASGVGRRVRGFTRVFDEGGTREELAILHALFWLFS